MDQITHQNASQVEEAAAASASIPQEAQELAETVSVSKVPGGHRIAAAAVALKRAAAPRVVTPAGEGAGSIAGRPTNDSGCCTSAHAVDLGRLRSVLSSYLL